MHYVNIIGRIYVFILQINFYTNLISHNLNFISETSFFILYIYIYMFYNIFYKNYGKRYKL